MDITEGQSIARLHDNIMLSQSSASQWKQLDLKKIFVYELWNLFAAY